MKSNPLIEEAFRLVPHLVKGKPVVYFLRLKSGAFYIGSSVDLPQRLDDHLSRQACRTTQLDPPISVLMIEFHPTFTAARHSEAQLKRWSRAKKEALIRGNTAVLRQLSESQD